MHTLTYTYTYAAHTRMYTHHMQHLHPYITYSPLPLPPHTHILARTKSRTLTNSIYCEYYIAPHT